MSLVTSGLDNLGVRLNCFNCEIKISISFPTTLRIWNHGIWFLVFPEQVIWNWMSVCEMKYLYSNTTLWYSWVWRLMLSQKDHVMILDINFQPPTWMEPTEKPWKLGGGTSYEKNKTVCSIHLVHYQSSQFTNYVGPVRGNWGWT